MTTIRVAKRDRYTAVARPTLNDERLSFRARGVLVWLLDKPDDWRVDSESIASAGLEGRDAIRAALKELEDHAYLKRVRLRDEAGRYVTEVTVFERPLSGDVPSGIPVAGLTSGNSANGQVAPATGNPASEDQALLRSTETETGRSAERSGPVRPRLGAQELRDEGCQRCGGSGEVDGTVCECFLRKSSAA